MVDMGVLRLRTQSSRQNLCRVSPVLGRPSPINRPNFTLPRLFDPRHPPKGSGPVTADSEGGADGSGASLRLAIGN
jgi:hypothetical protein